MTLSSFSYNYMCHLSGQDNVDNKDDL